MVDALFFIGISANVINLLYNVPLVYRPLKTRSIDNISAYFVSMRLAGTVLWILYGGLDKDVFLILTNIVTLLSTTCLISFVLFQRKGYFGFKGNQHVKIVPTLAIPPANIVQNPQTCSCQEHERSSSYSETDVNSDNEII